MKRLVITLLILSICACASPRHAQDRYDIQSAALICDVDSLATERERTRVVTNQTRKDIMGTPDERTRDETLLLEKLSKYDAEIEGAYRNTVMFCKAYARCMEANNAQEFMCTTSASNFKEASKNFNALSVKLRELKRPKIVKVVKPAPNPPAPSTRAEPPCPKPNCHPCPCCHPSGGCPKNCHCPEHKHPSPTPEKSVCDRKCTVINGIFSAGCASC